MIIFAPTEQQYTTYIENPHTQHAAFVRIFRVVVKMRPVPFKA